MATYANLFVDQGSDYSTSLIIEDSKGDPLDVTDVDISGQVRRTYQSETAFDFTIEKIDEEGGEIEIRLSDTITAAMRSGRYVYDVYGEDIVSGSTFKIIEGILEIVPRVTRTD